MKSLYLLPVVALSLASSICGCKKSESNDLTAAIVGKYLGADAEITVNKIDNSTVSMLVKPTNYCYSKGWAFSSVKMNSSSAFTLNEIKYSDRGCTKTINGTGTVSNKNISVFTVLVTDKLGMTCCLSKNETENFSGTK